MPDILPPSSAAPGSAHVIARGDDERHLIWTGAKWVTQQRTVSLYPRALGLLGWRYIGAARCPACHGAGKLWHHAWRHGLRYATWCPCCMGTGEASAVHSGRRPE
jgi:hypothetical protein